MANTTSSKTTANKALSPFLTVLTRSKDILYKDFMDDFPSYMKTLPASLFPDKSKNDSQDKSAGDEVSSYEKFCQACEGLKDLNDKKFFEAILESHFTRMGYDITEFQDSKKLLELIRSILALTLKVIPLVQQLIGKRATITGELQDAFNMEDGSEFDVKKFFKDPDWKDIENIKFDEKDDNKISAILNLIVDVIKLIRKNEDFNAKNIRSDQSAQFEKYFNDTHAYNKFPEHFFNHLFVLLFSKSKDILANDKALIADITQEMWNSTKIQTIVNNLDKESFDKIQKIREKNRAVAYLKNTIKKIKDEAKEKAKKEGKEIKEDEILIPLELPTQLKIANARLDRMANDFFEDYNLIATIFHAIYTILDFIQIIDKERILVAKFSVDEDDKLKFPFPVVKTDEWFGDKWFYREDDKKEGDATSTNKTKLSFEEVAKAVADAVKKAKSGCPTEDVNVTCWKNFGDLFTDPVAYFNQRYPINDSDDAEEFLAKITKIVKSFNPHMPDYDSIYQMLYELLFRVKDRINEFENDKKEEKNSAKKTELEEASNTFKEFAKFIIDLLKVLEGFAIRFKQELSKSFEEYAKDTMQDEEGKIIKGLKTVVDEAFDEYKKNEYKNENSTEKKKIVEEFTEQEIKDIFIKPITKMLNDKSSNFEMFKNISADEWKAITGLDDSKDLITKYKEILQYFQDNIVKMKPDDNEWWNERFKGFVKQLQTEFTTQIKKVPDDYKLLKTSGENYFNYDMETALAKDPVTMIENAFSNFDYATYLKGLSTKVKSLALYDASLCYAKFRTDDPLFGKLKDNGTVSKNKGSDDDVYKDNLKHLIASAFTACWPQIEKQIQKRVAKPFYKLLDEKVKAWATEHLLNTEAIKKIQEGTKDQLYFNENNISGLIKDTDQTKKPNAEVAKGLLLLNKFEDKDDEKVKANLAYWKDALQFALNLHKIVPVEIKNYLRDLIDLPDKDIFHDSATCNFDLKNRFFAATLYNNYEKEDGKDKIEPEKLNASIGLVAYIGERTVKIENKDKTVWGLYLLPKLNVDFDSQGFPVGESHQLKLGASAKLNKPDNPTTHDEEKAGIKDQFGVFLSTQNDEINADWMDVKDNIQAYLNLEFSRKNTISEIKIFDADFAALTLKNYPQKLFVGYTKVESDERSGFDFGYLGKLDNLVFTLKLRELNDFFAMILSNDIEIIIGNLSLGLSLKNGFDINGQFRVRIPINTNINLSVIKFNNLIIELGSGDMRNIMAQLLTDFKVDFSGIMLSFIEMGLGIDINYMKPDGSFGDFDLSPRFQFPSGIAVSVDLSAVKGVGIIRWNVEKEEFLGALELNILDMVSASALVLFNMKMPDGSKGFSFMGALSVFFTPGIQIGMGFSLTGVGGSLGLNRKIDTNKLRDAVRDGSLGSILFVKDLAKDLDKVLANVTSYYPVQKDQYFFGFLAQISYAEILKAEVGMFIQFPNPMTISIAGGIHLKIADGAESLLAINVYFLGTIDFNKGLDFDASLVDSKVVGIELYGDMAMRIYWAGDTKGFIMSVGGFHPIYKPEAGFNLGKMRRLGMKLDYGILQISLETYFAITSNTVQFGAALQLKVGWDDFGLFGELTFDALFQFNPFWFTIGMTASIAAKLGSWTLASIRLALELSGPAQWNAKGKAGFKFLFVDINVEFDETWGKKQTISSAKYVEIEPMFTKNFHDNGNWRIASGDIVDGLVRLYKADVVYGESSGGESRTRELVMQPSDRLSFCQNAVPLGTTLLCYGEAFPGDVKEIKLASLSIGGMELDLENEDNYEEMKSSFAPSLIRPLTKDQKLRMPSYEKMPAGFKLRTSFGMETGAAMKIPEQEIAPKNDGANWDEWLAFVADPGNSAPTRSTTERPFTAIRPYIETVRIADEVRLKEKIFGLRPDKKSEKYSASKASFRRMNNGFKRYTRELDEKMNRKLDHHIENL